MSNIIVISTSENLIERVASVLETTKVDLSDQIVIFPGRRPAHFLRKRLSELIGKSYIPPKIFSIDDFIEFIAKDKLGIKYDKISPLDAVNILFDIHKGMKEKIGGNKFDNLDRFLPLGLKLFGEIEELKLTNIGIEKIKSHLQNIPYGTINLLGAYYEEFYKKVTADGFVTRSVLYSTVAEQIDLLDLDNYTKVIFAGFYLLTPVEKVIFNSIRRRNNSVLIFQRVEGLSDVLIESFFEKGNIAEVENHEQPEIYLIKSVDTHGQVFALNSILKESQSKGMNLDEKSVIVLPKAETLFPLYNELLNTLSKENYNIALGYPLIRTPIFRFISTLTELIVEKQEEKISASRYLQFILHPYTKNIKYNGLSEVTRILMHTIEKKLLEEKSKRFFTLNEIENWSEVLDLVVTNSSTDAIKFSRKEIQEHLVSIHNNTIRLFDDVNTIVDFASKCIEVITYIYDNSTANLHPFFHQYAEKIIEVFESIKNCKYSSTRFEEKISYLIFLNHFMAEQYVPFTGTPLRGLQVLGLLETRNLMFDNVFILDVNEGVIPPIKNDDLLLPQSLRKELGLETYKTGEKLVEYYFKLLISSAKRVYIFFVEDSTGENERSRFIRKLLWQEEKRKKEAISDNLIRSVKYKIQLTNKQPQPIQKTHSVISHINQLEYSATMLDTYLRCPIQFYYKYILKLREKETVDDEVEQLDVGEIVHSILRELFNPFVGSVLKQVDIQNMQVEEVVKKIFRQKYGEELIGSQYLLYQQVKSQIENFLRDYQIPLANSEEIEIIGVETNIKVIDENRDVLFSKIDRVERRGGKLFIVDYKISSNENRYLINWKKLVYEERKSWNKAIGSLQLPFYLFTYKLYNYEKDNIIPVYLFLGKRIISPQIEIPLMLDNPDYYNMILKIIYAIINEIKNQDREFTPSENLSDTCPYCPYTTLCGTGWIK